jgi:hypothetical protein
MFGVMVMVLPRAELLSKQLRLAAGMMGLGASSWMLIMISKQKCYGFHAQQRSPEDRRWCFPQWAGTRKALLQLGMGQSGRQHSLASSQGFDCNRRMTSRRQSPRSTTIPCRTTLTTIENEEPCCRKQRRWLASLQERLAGQLRAVVSRLFQVGGVADAQE